MSLKKMPHIVSAKIPIIVDKMEVNCGSENSEACNHTSKLSQHILSLNSLGVSDKFKHRIEASKQDT